MGDEKKHYSYYDNHMAEYGSDEPPRWFKRALKRLDPALKARFNRRYKRWEIHLQWTRRGRINVHIMTVQEADGSYRPLDHRTLNYLREYDAARFGSTRALMKYINDKADAHFAEVEKDNKAERMDMWLDAADFVRCTVKAAVPRNYGKGWQQTESGLVVPV